MPIKDIIDGKVSGGRFVPTFLSADQPALIALAEEVIAKLQQRVGKSWGEICDDIKTEYHDEDRALKLLECIQERVQFKEALLLASPEQWRQQVFTYAQELRRTGSLDMEQYQLQVAAHFSRSQPELLHDLYGDLPEFRIVENCPTLNGRDYLVLFNQFLFIELLMDATGITCTTKNPKGFSEWVSAQEAAASIEMDVVGKKITLTRGAKLKKTQWQTFVRLIVQEFPKLVERFGLGMEFDFIWKKRERLVRMTAKDVQLFQ